VKHKKEIENPVTVLATKAFTPSNH